MLMFRGKSYGPGGTALLRWFSPCGCWAESLKRNPLPDRVVSGQAKPLR